VKIIEKEECSQVAERDINEQMQASDSNRLVLIIALIMLMSKG